MALVKLWDDPVSTNTSINRPRTVADNLVVLGPCIPDIVLTEISKSSLTWHLDSFSSGSSSLSSMAPGAAARRDDVTEVVVFDHGVKELNCRGARHVTAWQLGKLNFSVRPWRPSRRGYQRGRAEVHGASPSSAWESGSPRRVTLLGSRHRGARPAATRRDDVAEVVVFNHGVKELNCRGARHVTAWQLGKLDFSVRPWRPSRRGYRRGRAEVHGVAAREESSEGPFEAPHNI
ncbi:transmembrane channel-like protein 2 [Striga asiatica]|uniref:Transmembrane channel-like protein 2 n=1 Tax=Striga asiatica TaxID=4170 RepID=A0A5A7PLA8_STRAF|nr:transmembrane channel-like protein 2 [Striga asiatica]